jgi:6-phosphofructo-2-kinase
VAVFDATNTTTGRRKALCERARREKVNLLFVESICDDAKILERNYHMKLQNDDYKDMDPAQVQSLANVFHSQRIRFT